VPHEGPAEDGGAIVPVEPDDGSEAASPGHPQPPGGGPWGPPGGGPWGPPEAPAGGLPTPWGSATAPNAPPGNGSAGRWGPHQNTYARTPWDARRGAPPGQPGRSRDPRTVVWAIIGLAALVIVIRIHAISSFELLALIALVPSVILHEISHGVVALAFGDDTAKTAGRVSLNPARHVDPFGSVIMPAMLLLAHLGPIGYAKPVPVNVSRLRSPRNHSVLVSLAGPALNIVLALGCAFAIRSFVPLHTRVLAGLGPAPGIGLDALPGWAQFVFAAGYVNVILAAFNLIPLPPLDGSAVLERLLPRRLLPGYYRIRPYTMIVLLVVVLLFGAALADIFDPALRWWGSLLV